jgi:hypothetical protein
VQARRLPHSRGRRFFFEGCFRARSATQALEQYVVAAACCRIADLGWCVLCGAPRMMRWALYPHSPLLLAAFLTNLPHNLCSGTVIAEVFVV